MSQPRGSLLTECHLKKNICYKYTKYVVICITHDKGILLKYWCVVVLFYISMRSSHCLFCHSFSSLLLSVFFLKFFFIKLHHKPDCPYSSRTSFCSSLQVVHLWHFHGINETNSVLEVLPCVFDAFTILNSTSARWLKMSWICSSCYSYLISVVKYQAVKLLLLQIFVKRAAGY